MMPQGSIRLIAEKTGYSKSTVSLALRGSLSVAEATRTEIVEASRRMGYRVNPLVSALMTQQRQGRSAEGAPTLALVELYPDASAGTIIHLNRGFEGARNAALESGYSLTRFSIHDDRGPSAARLIQIIRSRGIRGVLLVHGGDLSPKWQGDWSEFSVVELASPTPHYNSVKIDFISSARLAVAELTRRGYRRIGWFCAESVEAYSARRWSLAFNEYNWTLPARDRVPPYAGRKYDKDALLTWYRRYRPDAVVTNGGTEYDWFRSAGYRIPEDFGYICINLLPDQIGRIAGLDGRYDLRMSEAVHMLDGLLRRNQVGLPDPPLILNVPSKWLDGESARRAPAQA